MRTFAIVLSFTLASVACAADDASDVTGAGTARPIRAAEAGSPTASASTAESVPRSAAPPQTEPPRIAPSSSPRGKAAPDFELNTLDGGTFTLSDHLGELPVVLNFWAPW